MTENVCHPTARIVLGATLRKQLSETSGRWWSSAIHVLTAIFGLLSPLFLSRLVDSAPSNKLGAYAGRYAPFLILGLMALHFQNSLVSSLGNRIRQAQTEGTLELSLSSPTPLRLLVLSLFAPDFFSGIARLLLYFSLGVLLFHLHLSAVNAPALFAVLALGTLTFFSLSLGGAALTMLLRRTDPLSFFLTVSSLVSGGVLYPRSVLPPSLALLGRLIPIAPLAEGVRASVIDGKNVIELASPLLQLLVTCAVMMPLGLLAFGYALRRARMDGSLST